MGRLLSGTESMFGGGGGGGGGEGKRNIIYIPKDKCPLAAPTIINGGRRERVELCSMLSKLYFSNMG